MPESLTTQESARTQRTTGRTALSSWLEVLVRTLAPIVFALAAGGLIIWAMGVNPVGFYGEVFRLGLAGTGWQDTLTAAAPLLLIGLGLIIAFRAKLWNLGYSGTYLLAAAIVAGIAPDVFAVLPYSIALAALLAIAVVIGAALAFLPAWLKAAHGTNEVVTSLMVSFVAIGAANLLVKGPLQDSAVTVPQTRVLDLAYMLPYIPGTRVHTGLVIALAFVLVFHVILTRSAFGLQIDVLGASPRVALHAGLNVKRLTLTVFVLSSGMFALAGAVDILGLWGYVRADWNPSYGDKVLPFVFLARLNPIGSIPLIVFYAVLATGGTVAAQHAGLSVDFLLIIVALILFFMTLIEAAGTRRDLGRSYVPGGLFRRSRQRKRQGVERG